MWLPGFTLDLKENPPVSWIHTSCASGRFTGFGNLKCIHVMGEIKDMNCKMNYVRCWNEQCRKLDMQDPRPPVVPNYSKHMAQKSVCGSECVWANNEAVCLGPCAQRGKTASIHYWEGWQCIGSVEMHNRFPRVHREWPGWAGWYIFFSLEEKVDLLFHCTVKVSAQHLHSLFA